MQAKVRKWGNSLALRIPSSMANDTGLSSGSVVDLQLDEGKIVINAHPQRHYTLDQLVKGITKFNRHSEVDMGPAVGREFA